MLDLEVRLFWVQISANEAEISSYSYYAECGLSKGPRFVMYCTGVLKTKVVKPRMLHCLINRGCRRKFNQLFLALSPWFIFLHCPPVDGQEHY